jgi:hypothetical protein
MKPTRCSAFSGFCSLVGWAEGVRLSPEVRVSRGGPRVIVWKISFAEVVDLLTVYNLTLLVWVIQIILEIAIDEA